MNKRGQRLHKEEIWSYKSIHWTWLKEYAWNKEINFWVKGINTIFSIQYIDIEQWKKERDNEESSGVSGSTPKQLIWGYRKEINGNQPENWEEVKVGIKCWEIWKTMKLANKTKSFVL